MKEQNKTLDKELNKMETSKLLDAKFKRLVIRSSVNLEEEQMNSELQQHKKGHGNHKKESVRNEGYGN